MSKENQEAAVYAGHMPYFDGRFSYGLSTNDDLNNMLALGNLVAAQIGEESRVVFGMPPSAGLNPNYAANVGGLMDFVGDTQRGMAAHGQPAAPGNSTSLFDALWYPAAGAAAGGLVGKFAGPRAIGAATARLAPHAAKAGRIGKVATAATGALNGMSRGQRLGLFGALGGAALGWAVS